jgi:hypothetical protein
MVIILACVFGPIMIMSMVSQIVVMPFMGNALMQIQQATENHEVLSPDQIWAIIGPTLRSFVPLWIAYEIITLPVILGLQNAVSAFAYMNLTRSEIPA